MNLTFLLPWLEIKKLTHQVKLQKQIIQELEQQLTESKSHHVDTLKELREVTTKKDEHIRRLGMILALKGGIAVLFMLCLSLQAQPEVRTFTTTNYVGLNPNQFSTNPVLLSAVVTLTNVADGSVKGTLQIQVDGSQFSQGNSNFFNGFLPARSFGGVNNNTSSLPIVMFANRENTDGSLLLVVSNSPFYGPTTNLAAARTRMVDSLIVGNTPNSGDGVGNPADGPFIKMSDSVIVGLHDANNATNISQSIMIGYGAMSGLNANDGGTAPADIERTTCIDSDVGAQYQMTNSVGNFFMGNSAGVGFGPGGGVTNCAAIGVNAGTAASDPLLTNSFVFGANCDLPHGHPGEMSLFNFLYGTNLNAHGRGNLGVGTKDPTNVVQVLGVTDSTYGNISKSRNTLTPVVIAVGGSPFTFKNDGSAGNAGGTNNINVFVDAGTVSSITVNGGTVYTSTGKTVPLQPGESMVVTYSGLPTMTYKPF